MVAVAPGDVVLAVQIADPGVIAVFLFCYILVAFKNDGVVADVPVDAILRKTHEDIHLDGAAVAAENAGKAVTKGDNGAVEYTVGTLRGMAANNGVFGVAPHGHGIALGPVLPGDILEFVSNDPAHKCILLFGFFSGSHLSGLLRPRPRQNGGFAAVRTREPDRSFPVFLFSRHILRRLLPGKSGPKTEDSQWDSIIESRKVNGAFCIKIRLVFAVFFSYRSTPKSGFPPRRTIKTMGLLLAQ